MNTLPAPTESTRVDDPRTDIYDQIVEILAGHGFVPFGEQDEDLPARIYADDGWSAIRVDPDTAYLVEWHDSASQGVTVIYRVVDSEGARVSELRMTADRFGLRMLDMVASSRR